MSLATRMQSQIRNTAIGTVANVLRTSRSIVRPHAQHGYPFGAEHNFGIVIEETTVTILRAVTKRGSHSYELNVASASLTIEADLDWIAIKMTVGLTPGSDTFAFARYANRPGPPLDHESKSVVALHQFRLIPATETDPARAVWHFSTHFDGVYTTMGH